MTNVGNTYSEVGLQPHALKTFRKLRRQLRRSSTGPDAKARIDAVLKRVSENAQRKRQMRAANDNELNVGAKPHARQPQRNKRPKTSAQNMINPE